MGEVIVGMYEDCLAKVEPQIKWLESELEDGRGYSPSDLADIKKHLQVHNALRVAIEHHKPFEHRRRIGHDKYIEETVCLGCDNSDGEYSSPSPCNELKAIAEQLEKH